MHGQAAVARLHVPKSHCEQKEVSALARAERAEQPPSQLPACSGMGGGPSWAAVIRVMLRFPWSSVPLTNE